MCAESATSRIKWAPETQTQFETILQQIPALIRGIAETRVSKKAESLVRSDGRSTIEEKDMVDAFFAETPSGFMDDMRQSMRDLGINYESYGHM